ncbi:MAG TPA: hypothetical protein P5184_11115 [Bacteroidales bacterium]|nr:hypothetical protein [Bacteroidales bacterium]
MKTIKILEDSEIQNILSEMDKRVVFEKTNIIPESFDLYDRLRTYVKYDRIGFKSVLGIDIFQYSGFGEFEQALLPFVFKTIFKSKNRALDALCCLSMVLICVQINLDQVSTPRITRSKRSLGWSWLRLRRSGLRGNRQRSGWSSARSTWHLRGGH